MSSLKTRKTPLITLAALFVLGVPTLVMAESSPKANTDTTMPARASAETERPKMGMSKSMEEMNKKMSGMTMTGNQDYDFAMMMRMHHQGAIDMAQMELDMGKDPAMRSAAKKIIASQKKEIAQFDQWIAKHKPMDTMAK